MRKSPGPDDIVTEMLLAAGDMGIAELTKLSNMIYIQGGFPSERNKSIFITLPKVNGATKCEKHRTISLMSHITKLVLRIVINRIRGRTPPAMGARFTVFGHSGHADPLDGWRCCSQKRVMSRPIQVRQL